MTRQHDEVDLEALEVEDLRQAADAVAAVVELEHELVAASTVGLRRRSDRESSRRDSGVRARDFGSDADSDCSGSSRRSCRFFFSSYA